jgi:hypothetical protein
MTFDLEHCCKIMDRLFVMRVIKHYLDLGSKSFGRTIFHVRYVLGILTREL